MTRTTATPTTPPTTFRASMGGVHTWAGLVFSWVLYFMFVTGTLGYIDTELDRWAQPELASQPPVSAVQATAISQRYLQTHHPDAEEWFISLPTTRDVPWLRVFWHYPEDDSAHEAHRGHAWLDVRSGEVLVGRDTGGGQTLYRMHYELAYMSDNVSRMVIGLFTLLMLLALVTGVIIHRNIFREFFSFRPGKRQRSWLDIHNLSSVASLPFQLMITYSGLIFFLINYMPFIAVGSYGFGGDQLQAFIDEIFPQEKIEQHHQAQPVPDLSQLVAQSQALWPGQQVTGVEVHWPGDSGSEIHISGTADSILRFGSYQAFNADGEMIDSSLPDSAPVLFHQGILGLHEGRFAGPFLRLLYLLSGVLGTLMIASGLILWTVKRRAKQLKQTKPDRGFMLVERLNAGSLIGLPIAIAVYFIANRLLPLEMTDRAAWEQHLLFISWGLILCYSGVRPIQRCWHELSLLASAAYAVLPVISLLTVEQHLLWALQHDYWPIAGVELGFIGFAALFALIAQKMRHWQPAKPTIAPASSAPNSSEKEAIA